MTPGTSIDVEQALVGLGLRNVRRSGSEVVYSCPFPEHRHGDRRPSARMNAYSTAWYCHGCKAAGGSMRDLITAIHGGDPNRIDDVEEEIRRISYRRPEGSVLEDLDALLARPEASQRVLESLSADWYDQYLIDWALVLAAMMAGEEVGALVYPFERGFTADTLNRYDIGWDPETQRMLIPIWDANGVLVGVKGRATRRKDRAKYLAMGDKPYPKSEVVYLLHDAEGVLVVCEGELNALACRQAGVAGAVAVGGSAVSKTQLDLLISRGRPGVVLFFDDDRAGNDGTYHLARSISSFVPVKIVGPHEGDPASMDADDIWIHIRNATPYAIYELERSLHGQGSRIGSSRK